MPATVGRRELSRDIEGLPVLAHLESAAAGPQRLSSALHARRLGGENRLKQVEPQLLVGSDPQIPLVDSDEDGRLRDGIGAEVVKLHTVVVRERPHELVRRQTKASLMENDKAHHVAVTWPRLRLAPRSNPLQPIGVSDRAEKTSIDKRLQHLH